MSAFAGKQGPRASDDGAVKWAAIVVLTIAIVIVATPGGAALRLDFEQMIDDLDRVENARVVCRAQAEPNERQRIGTNHFGRADFAFAERSILDDHLAAPRRNLVVGFVD